MPALVAIRCSNQECLYERTIKPELVQKDGMPKCPACGSEMGEVPGRGSKAKKDASEDEESESEGKGLRELGSVTVYRYEKPSAKMLEVFKNSRPDRDYEISLLTNEFTSLCPKTGQPDFAEVEIRYIPNEWCVETKSLKLYLFAYRQEGAFMETITNRILEHLVEVLSPRRMTVECRFNPRGGIALNCVAVYEQPKTEYAPEVK